LKLPLATPSAEIVYVPVTVNTNINDPTNNDRLGVFIGLCLSFWIGGFAAFHGTSAFQSSSLYIPAAIYFLLGIHLFFSSKE